MLDPNPSLPVPSARRGHPLIAWVIILGIVSLVVWRNQAAGRAEKQAEEKSTFVLLRIQGRLYVGMAEVLGEKQEVIRQVQDLNNGPPEQRLCCAVLLGELDGPAAARAVLEELLKTHREETPSLSAKTDRLAHLLLRLYTGYEKHPGHRPDISVEEQALLRQQLGWFGALALAPRGGLDPQARREVLAPVWRTIGAALGLGVFLLFAFFAGGAILILMTVLWLTGRLDGGLETGTALGGIYAETFALYMLLFVGLSYAFHFVPVSGSRLWLSGAAALGSLAALAWPLVRGVSWRTVRQDVGLFGGRSGRELLYGLGCYLASIPVLAVGVLIYFGLTRLQRHWQGGASGGPGESPVHPIVGQMAAGGWWVWLQMLLVASVVAPVVEETMFRGVLYRHLREASGRWGRVLSTLVSALLSSFVFAVIHPQGLLAVPPLMGLACVFCLVREFCGSLLPSMIAHGINNGVIIVWMVLAAS